MIRYRKAFSCVFLSSSLRLLLYPCCFFIPFFTSCSLRCAFRYFLSFCGLSWRVSFSIYFCILSRALFPSFPLPHPLISSPLIFSLPHLQSLLISPSFLPSSPVLGGNHAHNPARVRKDFTPNLAERPNAFAMIRIGGDASLGRPEQQCRMGVGGGAGEALEGN